MQIDNPEERSTGEPPTLPDAPSSPRHANTLVWPVALALAGVVLIGVMALVEKRAEADQVWRHALMSRSGEPPWDNTLTIFARKLPAENFPPSLLVEQLRSVEGGSEAVEILGLDLRETVVAVDVPSAELKSLAASGRVPEPGKHEVLAGMLCRLDHFMIDGTSFEVVGHLQRGTAGFAFSYLLPYDDSVAPLFSTEAGATQGWLDPEGLSGERPEDAQAADEEREKLKGQHIVPPLTPTTKPVAWGGFWGIMLVMVGGAVTQVRLLRLFNARYRVFGEIINPIDQFPRLFLWVHLLCYGAMTVAILVAFAKPLLNLQVLTYVTQIFTTGYLRELGAAYMSGDVMAAAWRTFVNNFIFQTLVFSVVPSLFIPFLGLFKTMLSLAVAGFALAPIWTDLLGSFTYHSITLSLEVEAYVIAAFAVCLYPVYVVRAFRSDDPIAGLGATGKMVGLGTLLSGALLLFAALFEAVTLILIG